MSWSTLLKHFDWPLLGAVLVLFSFGLTALWGLSFTQAIPVSLFIRQLIWGGLAISIIVLVGGIDYRLLRDEGRVVLTFYLLGISALVLLVLAGSRVRGATSWFQLPFATIEPIEFAKIILVILLAKYFSSRHIELYGLRHIIISGCYAFIPAFLAMLQPDLGSAIVVLAVWFGFITLSGIRFRHFLLLCAVALLTSFFLWTYSLSPYQKDRIRSFLYPQRDPLGTSYNVRQSVIAVGSGRLLGKGLGYGTQSHLKFLPEAENDFIFAAIVEEWGFVGGTVLLAVFGFLLWRIMLIGFRAGDNFARFFSLGLALLIFIQLIIHAGMNMGLLPVTGLTLPFVSYGGSSLISLSLGIGLLQSIALRARSSVAEEYSSFLAF